METNDNIDNIDNLLYKTNMSALYNFGMIALIVLVIGYLCGMVKWALLLIVVIRALFYPITIMTPIAFIIVIYAIYKTKT